ncbi:SDR family oxidoreductase [Microbacterium sp. UBA3394]|uniref:SDR family NAD(P)-dependent oxidoreductase n=1 Tax=Microbacterium sp. UBA3394 TaxID=1946945 RepID=UPI000C4B2EFA|nr:SDR family oxidoreductase [Microbacterium sp. UBA3394]MAM53453.1 3-oxoacyl-ACP reductase [Microbacterium sp.]|tara:strand:- start:924 stop:1694 length:771 start_codon:yes stop_codon:yes gene_type:complete
MDIKDYRIIVTGGASGMGAATVRNYVAAGANVVSMDVAEEAGQDVVAAAAGPGSATFMRLDVSNAADVEATFDLAAERLGGLDVLAHPAAIQRSGDAASVTVDDWDAMFAVNVRGTMLANQAAYRLMAPNKRGSIINFGSISGLRPEAVAPAYSASKGAVHSWTRTAAAAWGPDGVRVNAILPAIATPMYDAAIARLDDEGRTANYWMNEASIALGHAYGDPDRDLGPVMVFLASEASRFITGQLLPVDGGQASVR